MCCYLGEIPDFKPYNQWCHQCSSRLRCDDYEARPSPCRQFNCVYVRSMLGTEWYPMRSHMVVSAHDNPKRMTVLVDPETPMVWQETAYFPKLQAWARECPVTVMVGLHAFAVYPDRLEDLGELAEGEQVEITETRIGDKTQFLLRRCAPSAPA